MSRVNDTVSRMSRIRRFQDSFYKEILAAAWQNQQITCAPSEDSCQPGRMPSLISLRYPPEEVLDP